MANRGFLSSPVGRRPVDVELYPIPEGMRLTVPMERAAVLTEPAVAEQRCSPSFDFRLHLDHGMVHLEVRSPAEDATRLAALFAPAP
ncbi:hypothetical protein ACIQGZ_19560 [Streptomyces sp. NPDC092296]|uniref:hypothetical protein n=1 Tax=Streptomyces sp. NPDC092296 TaxID=3366012 RepID=UPI0037F8D06A